MDLLRPNTQPSYRSLRIEGARLHWCEIPGPSDAKGVPLLLLHGLHDSHLSWQQVAPLFGTTRRVLMPDLLGCGLSDRPDATYEISWHAHVIAQWLEAIGVQEVDVVGHSFGGGVGQMLLLEPSVRVRRLGLLASGGLGRDVGVWLRLATLPLVESCGQPFMRHGTRYFLRALNPSLRVQDLERMSAMNARKGSARAFARTVRDVIDWRGQRRMFFERAHEIANLPPVLICWGDRDRVIPIDHGIAFARTVDCVTFHRIEGAGHWLHHERPEQVVEALRAFIDEPQLECIRLPPAVKPLLARTVDRLRGLADRVRKPALAPSVTAGVAAPVAVSEAVLPVTAEAVVPLAATAGCACVVSDSAVRAAPSVSVPVRLPWHRALARWVATRTLLRARRA
jgi:pimeloyl-ACP methyl ester carboxylesterase